MKNLTKSGTYMYHPTIDWAEPNLSFSQSPPCHIPSMNVGLTTKKLGLPHTIQLLTHPARHVSAAFHPLARMMATSNGARRRRLSVYSKTASRRQDQPSSLLLTFGRSKRGKWRIPVDDMVSTTRSLS